MFDWSVKIHWLCSELLFAIFVVFAILLMANEAVRMIWGAQPMPLNPPESLAGPVELMAGFTYPAYRLFIIGFGAGLVYAAQIRAARGMLNWSQAELAKRSGVSKQSVTRIENGTMDPRFSTMTALNEAIRSAGVEMAEDVNGTVRLTVSRDKLLPPSE